MISYAREITKDKGFVEVMEHAGFKARLMCAERLKDTGNAHVLPPGMPIPVFPIAALPAAPKDWIREAGTYVVPAAVNQGLWFDWTMNDAYNVAVVPSCKGMNPITGMKLEGMQLQQFADKCPVHGKPFSHARLCEECGYEWPPQNYVCHPNTLWWDGFRQPDGKVRQFFFTDEDERDIASLVIGKENTVPAFGFAFFRPKNPRTPPKTILRGYATYKSSYGSDLIAGVSKKIGWKKGASLTDSTSAGEVPLWNSTMEPGQIFCSSLSGIRGMSAGGVPEDSVQVYASNADLSSMEEPAEETKSETVSVGAGAEIRQELETDSLGLDGWQEKESAVIRLYFVFRKQFKRIVKEGGVKLLESDADGFLKGLPTG